MPTTKDIASRRKVSKQKKAWTWRDAGAQCLKRRSKLTSWEVNFCTEIQDFQRISSKQIDTLLFCCEKCGVDWDPAAREPGDDR